MKNSMNLDRNKRFREIKRFKYKKGVVWGILIQEHTLYYEGGGEIPLSLLRELQNVHDSLYIGFTLCKIINP